MPKRHIHRHMRNKQILVPHNKMADGNTDTHETHMLHTYIAASAAAVHEILSPKSARCACCHRHRWYSERRGAGDRAAACSGTQVVAEREVGRHVHRRVKESSRRWSRQEIEIERI